MMKEFACAMVLLAICIPAMAVNMPDMVGNWTGTFDGVGWLKNTDYQTSGKTTYYESKYILDIKEQNGTRFAGKLISATNPVNTQTVLGIIGSDNETINMVDEHGYMWGMMNSSTKIELFYQGVDIDRMTVRDGVFTKE